MSATECAICLGVLTQPKVLSCLHTFCLSCLDQLLRASNNELICPTCRACTAVPPEGVKGLRTNFIIDQMLEFRKLCDLTCSACADSSSSSSSSSAVAMATTYCVDCGDNLCDGCVSAHTRIRTLKSHRLVEVGASDATIRLKELFRCRPVYCADHPNQEMALYCSDCSTSICLSCCVLSHKTHSYVDIKEQANLSRNELEKVIDTVSEKLSLFRRAEVELETKLATTTESSTQTVNEIRRRTNEFVAQVRFQENRLIESVQKYQQQFEKQIESTLEQNQTKIAGVENLIQLCQQLRDSGTHCDVLRLSSQVCATADELRAENVCSVPLQSLVLTPVNGNLSELNVLGEVVVIEAENECRTDLTEETLRHCGSWKMEDIGSKSSTECGNVETELNGSLGPVNSDPTADHPSGSNAGSDSVAQLLPSRRSENVQVLSLLREKSTVENQADCLLSNSSAIITASQENVFDSCQSSEVEVHRCFETQENDCSNTTASVDISDVSSEDQSEDDDCADGSPGRLQNRKGSDDFCDAELPLNDHSTSRRLSSDDRTSRPGSRDATPSSIPLSSIAGGYFEKTQGRRRGSADIETISGEGYVVGVALLDCILFVLRRNSSELELYDQNSLNLIRRELIRELAQPTDLTACAQTHTLYIGHTRRIVFSVKVSQSTLSSKKLSVADNYARISTSYSCSVLMGCPKAETILEYKEDPHWKLIRCIQMPGAHPTGMLQLSSNRFAVSSKMNVVYMITEEGPNSTCVKVDVPQNMSHTAVDITGSNLLVADSYGHHIRRLERRQGKAWSSFVLETKTISRPCRLWTDTAGQRLFVGTAQGDVKVLHLD